MHNATHKVEHTDFIPVNGRSDARLEALFNLPVEVVDLRFVVLRDGHTTGEPLHVERERLGRRGHDNHLNEHELAGILSGLDAADLLEDTGVLGRVVVHLFNSWPG